MIIVKTNKIATGAGAACGFSNVSPVETLIKSHKI